MALSIEHPEADRLARELARTTGEPLADAVVAALRERLARETGRREDPWLLEEIREIQERVARLAVQDGDSPEQILDYDEHGLPR